MLKRVLMTGDTVGGVWTFALELAEALGVDGVEVVLAAMGGAPSAAQRAEAARIGNLEVRASEYKLEWMEDPWADVEESGRWLLDLEQQLAPDLVHLNSFGHGALAWNAPVVLTAHSCVLSWWAAVKGEPAPESWNRYRATVAQSLRAADAVTAPSRAMAAALTEHYGMPPNECQVVANARNAMHFHCVAKEPFILTAGRLWDEGKNVGAVAQAAREIAWPVYIAGDNRAPDGRSARFEGCRMLGRLGQSELADWYARAAIYALPARYEPFGLSILEAALSGCVLVLGDVASLREIWDGAAVFVPPEDAASLAATMGELISQPARRAELAGAATSRARDFTPARMAREYRKVYEAAAARSRVCVS